MERKLGILSVALQLPESYYGGEVELVCVDMDGNRVTAQMLYAYSHTTWTYDLPDVGTRAGIFILSKA